MDKINLAFQEARLNKANFDLKKTQIALRKKEKGPGAQICNKIAQEKQRKPDGQPLRRQWPGVRKKRDPQRRDRGERRKKNEGDTERHEENNERDEDSSDTST